MNQALVPVCELFDSLMEQWKREQAETAATLARVSERLDSIPLPVEFPNPINQSDEE